MFFYVKDSNMNDGKLSKILVLMRVFFLFKVRFLVVMCFINRLIFFIR